jgi:hypothetical protein
MKLKRSHYIAIVAIAIVVLGGSLALIGPLGSKSKPAPKVKKSTPPSSRPHITKTDVNVSKPAATPAGSDEAKEEEPDEKPLFTMGEEWTDPFKGLSYELAELNRQIKLKQSEVELLKVQVEEKKLKTELGVSTGTRRSSSGTPRSYDVELKAVVISETEKSALLGVGRMNYWVEEGGSVSGWTVQRISGNTVTIKRGETTRTLSISSG